MKPEHQLATRRNFLKWLSFGGVGAVTVFALSQLFKKAPLELTKIQFTSVKLDFRGNITDKPFSNADIFKEDFGNGIVMNMVRVPAGIFTMGSPDSQKERNKSESPQHLVTVSEFYLGQTLVTQAQWQIIMGNNPSVFRGNSQLPVDSVTWLDSTDFCNKLSEKVNKIYRLPTEAEWEYACRAGTSTPFSFGDAITSTVVNYNAEHPYGMVDATNGNYPYDGAPKGEFRDKTTPVGSFPPNLFGLYDMHGNINEWCLDEWIDNYNVFPSDGSARGDVSSRDKQKEHVFRGGACYNYAYFCCSSHREYGTSLNPDRFTGMRVATVLPKSS